jgi:tRNA dimethylallyltransferase
VGPTATGKSALAEALAAELHGEILSADSMQVYRGMDIGTAKVPPEQRGVAYHCVDLVAPDEQFNAFQYQKTARLALEDMYARGKQPILCGGTGLYIRAALEDFVGEGEDSSSTGLISAAPDSCSAGTSAPADAANGDCSTDPASSPRAERRQCLNALAEELGPEAFHARLAAADPESAALIHPHNVRRVVRAFEWLEEGSSYAQQASGFATHDAMYPAVYLGLDMSREQLYARIDARVREMVVHGLLEEVRTLLCEGYGQALTAQQAIGYKELITVVSDDAEGEDASLEAAITQIQQATRHYAKRQLSWFRRDERIHWLDALLPLDELTAAALDVVAGEVL